ncbi:hypothetical protein OS493_033214 [Desmophyllum pertusum]|uniref:Uncharacterized protein n=1 Tax=Desmophyllum pertusum TaxID=174260 RepID=A0A9W9Y853_9CNID|nr:hypothetical protein OS493_033214 [Desmophyllum pertusum]
MKELSRRGDVPAIGYNISKAFKAGHLKDKAGLLGILKTISQNLSRKKKGKRYSATTKDFYEVLLTIGGPRLCEFMSHNLDGPHIHSTMVWRNKNVISYMLGGHRENIVEIAGLYKKAKEMMSLQHDVPYITKQIARGMGVLRKERGTPHL